MILNLTKNRAEEFRGKSDEHFIYPHYYHDIDLLKASKSRIIVGGRGCGKTMLLLHFSHQSQFKIIKNKNEKSIESIGLYWRVDRAFTDIMLGRGKEERYWISPFKHHIALTLSKEILNSLETIAKSQFGNLSTEEIRSIDFSILKNYDSKIPSNYDDLFNHLKAETLKFDSWLSNIYRNENDTPVFLSGANFLKEVIKTIQEQVPALSNTCFYPLIDEFETLKDYQTVILNEYIKYSEAPLIFHVAMKRGALNTNKATEKDGIQNMHDFVMFDLEEMQGEKFKYFAAEVLINESRKQGFYKNENNFAIESIESNVLSDPERISERENKKYKESILIVMNRDIPSKSHEQLANEYIENKSQKNKLKKRIESKLKYLESKKFIKKTHTQKYIKELWSVDSPSAMIILPALLSRHNTDVNLIINELKKYKSKENNKFDEWIKTNFVGCYLHIYQNMATSCPIYSGYNTFIKMAAGNLRHFLGLVSESITANENLNSRVFPVDEQVQYVAATIASKTFLQEIKSSGDLGYLMHKFVVRLGKLFVAAHKRDSQSEPEQNHFSIKGGLESCDEDIHRLFKHLIMYSIIKATDESKIKSKKKEFDEFVLNPIYSAAFKISYRKIRRISLTGEEIKIFAGDNQDLFDKLIGSYERKWDLSSSLQVDIFSL